MRRLTHGSAVAAIGCAAVLTFAGLAHAQPDGTTASDDVPLNGTSLNDAFADAAQRHDVPRELLASLAYTETRLVNHGAQPSQDNGFGPMHLESNVDNDNLTDAARLTGTPVEELQTAAAANVHGAAAVLRELADESGLSAAARDDLAQWYEPVARYARGQTAYGARLEADAVFTNLREGFAVQRNGERVAVPAHDVRPERGAYANVRTPGEVGTQSDDYPDALWVPASESNYTAGRESDISAVVIHVTQGSYAGTISWFQNPDAEVSAHYVVQSSDGEITQMVREADTAWHARDGNPYSVGIEHEGYVDDPAWFTDVMYRSSAALTADIAAEYGIPLDREHIVGHSEVPGNDHTDPGPHWDWDLYMSYVTGG